jgi:aspartate aminotransferase-like enzyme
MFGPNTYLEHLVKITYSHRERKFFDLYYEVTERFQRVFGLQDFDILFVPGSGTVGIEAAMFSVRSRVEVIGHDGIFKDRWAALSETYNACRKRGPSTPLYCQLETSCSRFFAGDGRGAIVDGISAFPYYLPPAHAQIYVTSSNKGLLSFVGLSIVMVRRSFWGELVDENRFSYLNLRRYKSYAEQRQTPSTTATHIFEHLNLVLSNFDMDAYRARLDRIATGLVDGIGEDFIIGDQRGPVITARLDAFPAGFARDYNLYGYWVGKSNYQFFTFSQEEAAYGRFVEALQAARKSQ